MPSKQTREVRGGVSWNCVVDKCVWLVAVLLFLEEVDLDQKIFMGVVEL